MVKSQCYAKAAGLKKGPWTPEEDQKLLAYIEQHGHGSWQALPAKAGLQRCGKSCRLRWINYLRPDIKRGKFNLQEEQTIIQLHALVGNKWSVIAAHLPKRTDNEIKNYWNTHLKKRLDKMGIDPTTHKPKADAYGSGRCQSAELRHMAQWESARLEAEARLAGESKPLNNVALNHFQKQLGSASSTTLHQTRPSRPPSLDVLKAWQNLVSGMFFNSNGQPSLESPTSTLNFPQKITPPAVSAPLFHENTSMEMITKNNDINIAGMNAEELNQMLQDKLMNASDADNAWNVDSFRAINEDARVDILDYKYNGQINMPSESCDEISLEDNKSYWNSLMSWVDAGPSYFPML